MVLALVLLPALAGVLGGDSARSGRPDRRRQPAGSRSALTLGKVALFLALVLVVGQRVIPWVLAQVARTGSRELFTLVGAGDRARHRLRLGRAVRRLLRARRLLRRRGAERERLQPPGRRRFPAACRTPSPSCSSSRSACCSTRRSWSREPLAVLAVLLVDRCSPSRSRRSRSCWLFGHPVAIGAHGLGEPRPDRRVLVHPGRPRRRAGPAAAGGPAT